MAQVLELEQQMLSTPSLSLPALQLGFGEFELSLPALHRLVSARTTLRTTHTLHLSSVHC